ncbi:branched-chain amino acid ABC transporter permease [Chloroflexota bacterium]
MEFLVLSTLNGLSYGLILFLLAAGISLIYGVMGILNLSHGALYMVGAYVGWSMAVQNGYNFWLAVLMGGLAAGLLGLVMERVFFRRLYKQLNEQVLLTFGFIYILTNLSIWIWGATYRASFTAPILAGSFHIAGLTYPIARITVIFIGLILAIGLWWLQDKTRVGAIVRAGMDNKEITMSLGINLGLVSTSVFFLGAFIAGFAGVIGAQLVGVSPTLSIDILLLSMVVLVIGGLGSVQGALLGGILIGCIDAFGKALFPELAMFFTYLAMIFVLAVRPRGLLGRR